MGSEKHPLLSAHYVRVRERHNGFVEFDFALGDPSLFVELILSEAAFDEFCSIHHAVPFPAADIAANDRYRSDWVQLGSADE